MIKAFFLKLLAGEQKTSEIKHRLALASMIVCCLCSGCPMRMRDSKTRPDKAQGSRWVPVGLKQKPMLYPWLSHGGSSKTSANVSATKGNPHFSGDCCIPWDPPIFASLPLVRNIGDCEPKGHDLWANLRDPSDLLAK